MQSRGSIVLVGSHRTVAVKKTSEPDKQILSYIQKDTMYCQSLME